MSLVESLKQVVWSAVIGGAMAIARLGLRNVKEYPKR
jgi:hypothetical protein